MVTTRSLTDDERQLISAMISHAKMPDPAIEEAVEISRQWRSGFPELMQRYRDVHPPDEDRLYCLQIAPHLGVELELPDAKAHIL